MVQNIWMSVDPYMRGQMRKEEGNSYIPPFKLGQPLDGACIGQIIASKNKQFAVGDYVLGNFGWREYWLSTGLDVVKVNPKLAPILSFLAAFGMTESSIILSDDNKNMNNDNSHNYKINFQFSNIQKRREYFEIIKYR